MSSTPTTPSTPKAPDLVTLVVGQPIAIAFFDGSHDVHFSIGHILSVGPVDPDTKRPTLSVAYPDPTADPSVLSSASWFKGYVRQAGVQHVSHPSVQANKVSVTYGHMIDLAKADEPNMPKPAGDGENPIFDRDEDDLVPTHVSIGQAALAQGAKEPGPTVVSPLINEAVANPAPSTPAAATPTPPPSTLPPAA